MLRKTKEKLYPKVLDNYRGSRDRELKHQLSKRGLLSDGAKGKEVFYISGDVEKHRAVIERLWNSEEALDLRSDPPATKATLS